MQCEWYVAGISIAIRRERRGILHMTPVSRQSALGVLYKKFGSFEHHSIDKGDSKLPERFPKYQHLIGRDTLEVLYRMMIVSATRLLVTAN